MRISVMCLIKILHYGSLTLGNKLAMSECVKSRSLLLLSLTQATEVENGGGSFPVVEQSTSRRKVNFCIVAENNRCPLESCFQDFKRMKL